MPAYFAWARAAGRAAFLTALAVYWLGCGVSADPNAADSGSGGTPGSGGSSGSSGTSEPAPELILRVADAGGQFYPPNEETVTTGPHHEIEIWIQTGGMRTVRFALLPNDEPVANGDTTPGDAALSATEVTTNIEGFGRVTLTAPGSPTTFLLRASVGTLASAQVRFSVLMMNRAALEVVPLYGGSRPVEAWTASFTPDKTCSELEGTPPEDGEGEKSSQAPVELVDVPVGPKLAITLRAERFAWGCANLTTAVEASVPERVEILVTDVPIRLDQSQVDLELSLTSLDAWTGALAAPLEALQAAIRDGAEDDVEALLDAMESSLDGSERADFASTRTARTWDTRVRAALGDEAGTFLTAPLERWLAAGLADLDGDGAFVGRLSGSEAAPGSAEFSLSAVFGLDPEEAGFRVQGLGPWMAPTDDVVFGVLLDFNPATFLVAAARAPAVDEVDGAESIGDALAELIPCRDVAAALTSYASCDAECAERVCRSGLDATIERLSAFDLGVAKLNVGASGSASVGADAELEHFEGEWLGKLEYQDQMVSLEGSASASSSE
ncbi:MAG TPA: hypothetical protein VGK73_12925 [Polyangiaceae bacterium]